MAFGKQKCKNQYKNGISVENVGAVNAWVVSNYDVVHLEWQSLLIP